MEDNKSAGVPDWNGQVLSGKKKEIFFVPYLTRPHALRHTFATRGMEKGIPPKVMQELLGHTSIIMTLDIYSHVLPNTKAQEIKKLTNMF